MIDFIKNILSNNVFAQGGLLVLLGGSFIGIVWKIYAVLMTVFNKLFFVEVKALGHDETFHYLRHWLHSTKYAQKYCSNLLVTRYGDTELYQPSYGRHIFIHHGRLYFLYYTIENANNMRVENISIYRMCCFNKREVAKEIINEGKAIVRKREYTGTNIYVSESDYWRRQTIRKDSFIPVLSNNQFDKIINDIEQFKENENWYKERGINYKRGMLFYGPPGNGKTTAILSIAQRFKKDLYILNLSDKDISEKGFLQLVSSVPNNAFLCIEDIDATNSSAKRVQEEHHPTLVDDIKIDWNSHSTQRQLLKTARFSKPDNITKENPKVSLSTMLNTFDGLFTPQGLVYFMTTNHIDKLDDALIRRGRIDLKIEFTNTDENQANTLFDKYFTNYKQTEKQKFCKWALTRSVSDTHSKLIEFKDDLQGLLGDIYEAPKRISNVSTNSKVAGRRHTNSRSKKTVSRKTV
jgi:chaperone BCS1